MTTAPFKQRRSRALYGFLGGCEPPLGGTDPPAVPPPDDGAAAPGTLTSILAVVVLCSPPPNTNQAITARRTNTISHQIQAPLPELASGVC